MSQITGRAASGVEAAFECTREEVPLHRLESFLRQLSHDVRNDLNAMELLISYIEDLNGGSEVRSALVQLHEAVRYGAKRMLRVSRAVQIPDLECVPYPADLLAEDLRDRLQIERTELAARVEWFFCGQRAVAPLDATLVLEALTELLENAAGFSPLESPLRLIVAQVDNGVRWCIEQDVLEPPNQADQWGTRPLVSTRRGHYGLGLFRVRRILQAHKASLEYRYNGGRKRLVTEVAFSGNTV